MDIDKLGNKEKITKIVEEQFLISYSTSGKIFKKEVAEESLLKTSIYFFNNGELIKSEEIHPSLSKKIFCEFEKEKLITEITLNKYDCITDKTTRKYDSIGSLIEYQTNYFGSIGGNKPYNAEYKNFYDNFSRLIKKECRRNSEFIYTEDICYDSKNNITLVLRKNSQGKEIYKKTNYYNFFDQLYKVVGNEIINDSLNKFEYLFEYNKNGDVSSHCTIKNFKSQTIHFEYEYDYCSNWYEKKELQGDKISKLYRRNFNYIR